MIFRRREKRSFWTKLRDLTQPRKGWRRGFTYIGRRVQRLPDTPHRIALGFACGAFASFTPFFTLHILVAVILAYAIRANILAGALGTAVGNPISFPFILAASMGTGNWLLGRTGGEADVLHMFWNQPLVFFESLFTPYLIGGIIPGLVCGLGFYVMLRPLVAAFQQRRRTILAERARTLVTQKRAAAQLRRSERRSASETERRDARAGAKPIERLGSALQPLRPPRPVDGS